MSRFITAPRPPTSSRSTENSACVKVRAPFTLSSAFAEDVAGLKEQYAYGETVQVPADGRVRILNFSAKPLDWSRVRELQALEKRDSPAATQ